MIATLLLTKDNVYVKEDGSLPMRPKFDKALLTGLVRGLSVSKNGYDMLPNSIKKEVFSDTRQPTFPITIPEISGLADILIVVRSNELCRGKEFRFDNFELLLRQRDIELYIRKETK